LVVQEQLVVQEPPVVEKPLVVEPEPVASPDEETSLNMWLIIGISLTIICSIGLLAYRLVRRN
ncbi:MAG: hypothetical protein QF462_16895, partial [Myxococcota bacterium]|nr:hypothetical protein [Myxococcota bacterium]